MANSTLTLLSEADQAKTFAFKQANNGQQARGKGIFGLGGGVGGDRAMASLGTTMYRVDPIVSNCRKGFQPSSFQEKMQSAKESEAPAEMERFQASSYTN